MYRTTKQNQSTIVTGQYSPIRSTFQGRSGGIAGNQKAFYKGRKESTDIKPRPRAQLSLRFALPHTCIIHAAWLNYPRDIATITRG